MTSKRRLPVYQSQADDSEENDRRPGWHWIGFGTLAIFTVWLPLATLGQALANRWAGAMLGPGGDQADWMARTASLPSRQRTILWVLWTVFPAATAAVASASGGYLVGRWGGPATSREPFYAGLVTAVLATALTIIITGFSWAPLVMLLWIPPFAALGGRWGRRRP